MPTVQARYAGTCQICFGEIREGELVAHSDGPSYKRKWIHARCRGPHQPGQPSAQKAWAARTDGRGIPPVAPEPVAAASVAMAVSKPAGAPEPEAFALTPPSAEAGVGILDGVSVEEVSAMISFAGSALLSEINRVAEHARQGEQDLTSAWERATERTNKLTAEFTAFVGSVSAELVKLRELRPKVVKIVVPGQAAVDLAGEIVPAELADLLFLAGLRRDVFIPGPSGCGKSFVSRLVAKALGLPFGMVSCSAGMSESQLVGRLVPTGEAGRFEFQTTQFIERYENGGVFLLDEIDAADANVLLLINAALANGELWLPARQDRPVARRHPDFVCLAAANTYGRGADRMYVGRTQLDAATIDRFRVVAMDYSPEVESALCADLGLRNWLQAVRANVRKHKLQRVVSTRLLRDLAECAAAGKAGKWLAEQVFAGWAESEIVKAVEGIDRVPPVVVAAKPGKES